MTTETTPDPWIRPHRQPGGGDAFLFYVVHGDLPQKLEVSGAKYRCAGLPAGVEFLRYGRTGPSEVVGSFRQGFLWDQLQAENPALAASVAAAPECAVVRGTVADPADLGYFRDVIGLLTCLVDQGGVSVFDPQMFRWWEPERWRTEVFEPDAPAPARHVTILGSEEAGGTEWLHTRGLRKFGRPDLSIHGVPEEHHSSCLELLNRFIHLQALGGVIPEGQEVRVAPLPPGMICRHRGTVDDPDFNNVHVEISWPAPPPAAP
jgi:hypothetical protein